MDFRTINQRRFPRRDSAAQLTVAGRELDLVDLSARGVCVQALTSMTVGETLPFALVLPGGNRVEGMAQVRWQRSLGRRVAHGMEFVEMRPWVAHRLTKHLNPRHFGLVEACDLLLEFGCALALLLAARAFFSSNPLVLQTAVEHLPWAFIGGGVLAAIYFAFSA